MAIQAGAAPNRSAIYWICVLALFTAALSNSVRVGVSGALKAALLDPLEPGRSGEMLGTVLGSSFLGFAISLLVISPLLDKIGARRIVLFAATCFVIGPVLVLLAGSSAGSVYLLLNLAMVIWGFGWGATEASINPVTATLYPDSKTGKLNSLHAWWPAGLIVGGLLSVFLFNQAGVSWEVLIALPIVPGILFGLWALRHPFPQTESAVQGVSFGEMMREPFKRPTFWVFFLIMFLTASAELAPGAWVDVTLSNTVGMPGILVLVYVSAIMFIMRHFAGTLARIFSDMGLLWMCTVPAAAGLYLLSTANSPVTALLAATLWALGVSFMWPTMLAAISRRFPRSGPWGIGLIGFAGALAIYFVLPQLGAIYDKAKLERAGGEDAFNALAAGTPEMQAVLGHASEVSFQTIAVIPLILFVIFGLVSFFERRHRIANSAAITEPAE